MKNKIINLAAFAILSLLWLAFLIALFVNQQVLLAVWREFQAWPLIFQIVVGLLVLPVFIGLWIWQNDWSIVLRVILVLGLAFATVYIFFPKKSPEKAVSPADRE